MGEPEGLVFRLRKRAEIRRQIPGRRSVQEGKPDRVADLLDEAALVIEKLRGLLLEPLRYNNDNGADYESCRACGKCWDIQGPHKKSGPEHYADCILLEVP